MIFLKRVISCRNAPAGIDSRFNKDEVILENGAAFDLVRAAVNLVLSGFADLIGTTMKLPLSTTYVTFIVAMGTSLADRAWSRESAVYRITGMLSVIGGWFYHSLRSIYNLCTGYLHHVLYQLRGYVHLYRGSSGTSGSQQHQVQQERKG